MVDKQTLQRSLELPKVHKGPRRYQRGSMDTSHLARPTSTSNGKSEAELASICGVAENPEAIQFLEERFGRNLNVSFVTQAKLAIRQRIAGSLTANVDLQDIPEPMSGRTGDLRGVKGLSVDDVYLYPAGMNAIYNAHRTMLAARGPLKSVSYGFPYIDTLKILEKFGPGCIFYGHGSSEDLDDLESRLEGGEHYLALFCEFPGNPLLKSPDLKRIRALSNKYDFAVVVDETIGNFINIHVLPYADVVVSSLTKVFTGEANVMGGAAVLNPQGRYYEALKEVLNRDYEDNYWCEDAIFMERNSRDFVSRIQRINTNAEAICDVLMAHPCVKHVYYPKHSPSRQFYDACRTADGGYGGLLSVTFHTISQAIAFFDRLETAKGPSLGTNFTLTSPYVILAHYGELDWAASFDVPADLVRVSVGLESTEELKVIFGEALKAAEEVLQQQ